MSEINKPRKYFTGRVTAKKQQSQINSDNTEIGNIEDGVIFRKGNCLATNTWKTFKQTKSTCFKFDFTAAPSARVAKQIPVEILKNPLLNKAIEQVCLVCLYQGINCIQS